MFDLSGMTALVTGASGGLGSAIAKSLAGQGARLAVSGSNVEKLDAFRSRLGADHVALPCNLSDCAAVDQLVDRVRLDGYTHPAQRVRCSPDGHYVVVTADQEPLASVLSGDLTRQNTFQVAPGPMGVAFDPDGRTALVANHGSGRITVVDLDAARPLRDFPMGVGVETLAFY